MLLFQNGTTSAKRKNSLNNYIKNDATKCEY